MTFPESNTGSAPVEITYKGEPEKLEPVFGTREHAEHVAAGRHPGVHDALQWLTFSHLPEPLRRYSAPFYMAGVELITVIRMDCPELTTALNKLIEAKDSAVRAGIKDSTGRAGSVPRPQTVVDPPTFTETHTEDTLFKVQAGLQDAGLSQVQVMDAINQMQNKGILFRERA